MALWKAVLTVNGHVFDYIHIRRGIFQEDSLSLLLYVIAMIPMTTILRQTGLGYQTFKSAAKISHLLYMDDLKLYGKLSNELESLHNTVRVFSTDSSMEFGLEECATLTIHKGKATNTEGLTLSNNNTIKGLSLEESYKYLGVQQAEDVKHCQVKKQTSAELPTEYVKY